MADQDRLVRGLRLGMAAGLAGMSVLHLAQPRPFEAMVPDYLPGRASVWNHAATAAEASCAALLASRRTAPAGGTLAFATFATVWVANIQAAIDGGYRGMPGWLGSSQAAWARVPLQLPLLWAAARIARSPSHG